MEITHLGSGICSQSWRMTGAILWETRPAMMIRSDCRGEGRNTSAPKRAISNRDAPMDIISIAQQARPNVIGQMEFLRIQLTTLSTVLSTTPSGVGLPYSSSLTTRLPFTISTYGPKSSVFSIEDILNQTKALTTEGTKDHRGNEKKNYSVILRVLCGKRFCWFYGLTTIFPNISLFSMCS